LAAEADAPGLTVVLGAELFGPRVGNALKSATVLVLGALAVLGAAREAGVIRARPARTPDALLRIGAWRIEAGEEACAIDADAPVAALEVELTTERRRSRHLLGRLVLEGVETQAAARTGGAEWALVCLVTLCDTTDAGAHLVHRAVRLGEAERTLGRRLRVAFVTSAEKAAAVAQRTVGDADIAGVVVASGDPE
jgi:hypothetical protein